jgi:hypothetical protein
MIEDACEAKNVLLMASAWSVIVTLLLAVFGLCGGAS